MKLKIEDKADRTAKGYEFICPIFRLDKTSLHQGLERLIAFNFKCYFILLMLIYDRIRLSLAAVCPSCPWKNCSLGNDGLFH